MQLFEITNHLNVLLGLQLSIARRAASMRNFQFGAIHQMPRGSVGQYALHIQCPWRLESPAGVVTGFSDLWQPAAEAPDMDWDTWDYDTHDNRQDLQLRHLLGGYDERTHSLVNHTGLLVVEAVTADSYGGAVIHLSGNYRLVLVPTGSRGEHWRLFQPQSDAPHLVCEDTSVGLHHKEDKNGVNAEQVTPADAWKRGENSS